MKSHQAEPYTGVLEWMRILHTYGLALVHGVPKTAKAFQDVTSRIAYQRPTMYGTFWDVKSVPQAINIAYTSNKIDLHQDLMYEIIGFGLIL